MTADNIWHSKLTGDISEATQFFIGADNMQVKTHVKNVRNTDKNGATVTCTVLDPDNNTNTTCNGTTGSDGYTAFTKIIPQAPAGTWTLRTTATDSNSNSTSGNYDETITYVSSYTAKYGIRTIGWNQEYHKGDTASFTIQTLAKNDADDWVATNVDSGTTPYYEIQYWDGSAWQTSVSRTNMTVSIANHTWITSPGYTIPNLDTQIGRKYSVTFNARIGGAQMSQLMEFAVVQQTAGDPITVAASPQRAIASDTVRLSIRESNLDATKRTGNASGTKVYIYDPNNTVQVNGLNPTELANGAYYYNYSLGATPTTGVWQVIITTDSDAYSAATNFEVNYQLARESTSQTISTNINTLTTKVDDILSTMRAVKTTVSDTTPTSSSFKISSSITTTDFYKEGIIMFYDGSLQGQLRRITAYNGTTKLITVDPAFTSAPANGDTVVILSNTAYASRPASELWSYTTRRLTDANLDSGSLAKLSDIQALNNISAADVWGYASRTITGNVTLANPQQVWDVAKTALTTTGSIGKVVADNLDTTVSSRSTLTAAQVWSEATRTITGLSDPALSAIATSIWSNATRTLTSYGNNITAQQVWDVLTSSLTTTSSIGKLLSDNIDTTISSRASQSSVNTISVANNISVSGSVSDTSPSKSSFVTNLGSSKDDFYKNMLLVFTSGQNSGQSRRISSYNGTTKTIGVDPELSYTPANGDTFAIHIFSVRAEELSGSSKSTIESVQSKLNTLAGTLPSDYKGMYEQLKAVADTLAKLGVLKGSGADSLYSVSAENKDDIKYLKNKLLDLQAALEINKLLLVGGKQNAVFSTYYTFNSVVLNMIIANPTNRKAKIPFKAYLPKEAKPEHIISSGGLKVDFEEASGSYIATGEFELDAGESITRQVEMKDIWIIDEGEITNLKQQAEELYNEAKKTAYSSQALILKNDTTTRLDKILRKQKESDTTPQEHILTYRDNQQELVVARDNLKKMSELVTAAGAGRGLLASVGGIQTVATWGIIVVLLAGLAIMSLFFYSMWRHQMMVVAALTSTTGSRRKHLPIGAIEGEIVGGGTSLLSLPNMPKLSVNWKWLLPKLKWLVILLIVSALVITIVKGIIPIKQLGQVFKSDKQQSVVEDKKEVKPTSTPAPTPTPQPKVEILETETGWLNVREEPNKQSKILLKANVGKQYVELGRTNDENGDEWVKIKLDSADQTKVKEGWVFGQYVKIIQK
ncbi:MAG: SH3 domain-containing protein [Patescibacteria group bacterium]